MAGSSREVIVLSDDDERPSPRPCFSQYVQEKQREVLKVKQEKLARSEDQAETSEEMMYATQNMLEFERGRFKDLLSLCKESSESGTPVPREAWEAVEQRRWRAERHTAQHPVQPQPQPEKKKQKRQQPPQQLPTQRPKRAREPVEMVHEKVDKGWAAYQPDGDSVEAHQLQPGDEVWGEWKDDGAWYKGKVTGTGMATGIHYDDGDEEDMADANARRWIRASSISILSSPPAPATAPAPAAAPAPAPATPGPMPTLSPAPSSTAAPTCDVLFELIRHCCCAGHTKRQRDDNFATLLHRFDTWAKIRAAPIEEVKEAVKDGGNAESKAMRIKKALDSVASFGDSLSSLRMMSRAQAQTELVRLTGFKDKNCATLQTVLNYLLDKEAWRSMMHKPDRHGRITPENHHYWHGKKHPPEASHCASFVRYNSD